MSPARVRGLYVIIDPEACVGRDPVEVARLALEGGASMLQWRDKRRDKGEQLAQARAVRELCARHGALFIANDHVDLALVLRADGVHLGQKDLPVEAVRPLAPPEFLIGVSTNNAEEARRAQAGGASYVAVGSIFPTGSKETTRPASPERLREVKAAVTLPVVAIGGINASNIDEVLAAGADAVAVISAVCGAADLRAAARELAGRFERAT
ncbi:MAG: thiamine-phosphate diphosphorylase [Chloroflexi bacterium RBG_16_68_14]|nr:MAG: thiamine-phosphate diphosphorylase [Chloroflexi bacterium RBG_16_68_14]